MPDGPVSDVTLEMAPLAAVAWFLRPSRAKAVVITVLVAGLLVTGCAALDSPEGVADRFTDSLDGTAGVVEVSATAHKPDPLSTEVDAEVTVEDDLDKTGMLQVIDSIAEFQRSSITVSALVENSWLTLPVTSDPEINRSVVDVAFHVAEAEEVESVLAAMYMEDQFSVEVVTAAEPFETFDELIDDSPYFMSLFVSNTDETLTVSGNSTSDMTAVTAVATGLLDADLGIQNLTVQPNAVVLTVAEEADIANAEGIAARIDDQIAVDVTSAEQ